MAISFTRAGLILLALLLFAAAGCKREDRAAGSTAADAAADANPVSPSNGAGAPRSAQARPENELPTDSPQSNKKEWRGSLADLLQEAEAQNRAARGVSLGAAALPQIDENRVAAAGIRKLQGKHLTLYTDLPAAAAVDELPRVFDLAVPQWCAYFGIELGEVEEWRLQGYLMDRKESFAATRLLPDDLPPFLHGFHRGQEVWLYEQPSDYYRRHLLLHEGTHGFMKLILGGAGPPWYMEGMAELLGTHRWQDGELAVGSFPRSKDETPMWGRIKIVQDDFAASRGLTLPTIFEMGPQAHLQLEPYGWSWAAAAFLDGHPRTQSAFRTLRGSVRFAEPEFSSQFRTALGDEWLHTVEEWQLFVAYVEYGYDLAREAVIYKAGAPLPAAGQSVTVTADRGWQSSGVLVEEGKTYRIAASGRYTIAQNPRPWECEPNGVTLRYHRGLPLGALLGTVRREDFAEGEVSALLKPGAIGLGRSIRAPATGVLYFRMNDSPAELSDNAGTLAVQITPDTE
jgi:hypothetical protein